jgi:ATP-dependent RNA circularization protein (DNA/RNA ligase family)
MEKDKIKWRKIAGTININGKDYKTGQVFWAYEDEVPESFRDTCIPLEELPSKKPYVSKTKFEVQSVGYGWYDVVNKETGKKINDKRLRENQAKQLIEELH